MASDAAEARVALVTGAARGIGAATVEALCASGFRVVAVDLCAGTGHGIAGVGYALATSGELAELSLRFGDRVLARRGDVRRREDLDAAVAAALERWGRLDVAVAAAAVVVGGHPLWQEDPAAVETAWQIDVLGVWHTAAAAVPAMLAGPDPSGCRFLALASTAASRGLFALSAYGMAKHAVLGLVRGLAADLAGTGVCAIALAPGATNTAMLRATADLYGVRPEELARHQLVREVLEPADIAATVAHCCSPAGRALNGSLLGLDGGFTG
jgi:SDR family mycofactocin-dependent oxidoreductase